MSNYTSESVSAFSVFKKEVAQRVKSEFPNMSHQERKAIIQQMWEGLSASERQLFEIKARLEEEVLK